VSHYDTLTRRCHRKSQNLMDPLKTAEGTGGAPTCFFGKHFVNFLKTVNLCNEKKV
jgi:uncharacterized protein (DUF983 family)